MNDLKISPLAPIRFYPIDYDFEQGDKFQNQDNRVSTGYNWENVRAYPYHLPIPKQWPDKQPGIDTMVVLRSGATATGIRAYLYDSSNTVVEQIRCDLWKTVSGDKHYRIWRHGETATELTDGYYTIKITNQVGTPIYDSEGLLIGDWFVDFYPFEYFNFENDFGLVFDNGTYQWTGRMLLPLRMYDPEPSFEKEVYKNDPGVLTTLRTIPQRVFNFDIMPVPVHVAETFQLACACSDLYLNRIAVNMEEVPEGTIIDGTNLKQISGKATYVDFNSVYSIERVETTPTDEGLDWDSETFGADGLINGNHLGITSHSVSGAEIAIFDSYTAVADELVYVVIALVNAGGSNLPTIELDGTVLPLVWGSNYFTFRFSLAGAKTFSLYGSNGQTFNLSATITLYSISN